jgi:hypothetical protein
LRTDRQRWCVALVGDASENFHGQTAVGPGGADTEVLMTRVHLISDSTQYDASLVSLADAAQVCAKERHWLVVGGHMVNLHILRAGLNLPLRYTHDADIAVEIRTIRRGNLIDRLRALGYHNATYSNRFDRDADGLQASIDLVVASYTTKHDPNIDADVIRVDGMPVVDDALHRDPVIIELIGERTDGVRMEATIRIPDIVSAIAMKSFAVAERSNANDAKDLANLLEVAHADGLNDKKWPRGRAFAAAKIQLAAQFVKPGSAQSLVTESPEHQARLREIASALVS